MMDEATYFGQFRGDAPAPVLTVCIVMFRGDHPWGFYFSWDDAKQAMSIAQKREPEVEFTWQFGEVYVDERGLIVIPPEKRGQS